MNKGTKGNNQNVKETKANLEDQLTKVGISQPVFKKAKAGYDTLFSTKRTKADINRWNDIGRMFFEAKEYMTEKKINLNSGYLTDIRTTYFKELTPQDVSNAVWLHKNFPEVLSWSQDNKRNLSNPASVKQAIRKKLVESKSDNADFQKFDLTPPKPVEPKPKGNEPKKNNVTLKDNLDHLELIANQLEKISTKQWSLESFKRFSDLNTKLSDFFEDLDERLQKANIVPINDDREIARRAKKAS